MATHLLKFGSTSNYNEGLRASLTTYDPAECHAHSHRRTAHVAALTSRRTMHGRTSRHTHRKHTTLPSAPSRPLPASQSPLSLSLPLLPLALPLLVGAPRLRRRSCGRHLIASPLDHVAATAATASGRAAPTRPSARPWRRHRARRPARTARSAQRARTAPAECDRAPAAPLQPTT
mmetsp:Transcript_9761/g.23732  ORF Transcript_9761/g.23732 Transcript_9761/m.23732 type:complete len:176 (+) Transcript_9761:44-571(+)